MWRPRRGRHAADDRQLRLASPTTSCSTSANWARTCEVVPQRRDRRSTRSSSSRPSASASRPGRATPNEAGISLGVLATLCRARMPILGVCLGHQAIGQAFGGRSCARRRLMHGKTSPIHTRRRGRVRRPAESASRRRAITRLWSSARSLPDCLEVTAWTADGEIMGLRHRTLPVEGVQFHPESILTEHGHAMLRISCSPDRVKRLRSARMQPMSITPAKRWSACIEHREIFHDEMLSLMRRLMSGELTPVQIAALTMGLRVKKETIGEIAAAAQIMREFATQVEPCRPIEPRRPRAAPAAMARIPSIFRPRRCSSPRPPARASPSTADAACRRDRAAPTCSRRSAPISMLTPEQVADCIAETRHRLHVRAEPPCRR